MSKDGCWQLCSVIFSQYLGPSLLINILSPAWCRLPRLTARSRALKTLRIGLRGNAVYTCNSIIYFIYKSTQMLGHYLFYSYCPAIAKFWFAICRWIFWLYYYLFYRVYLFFYTFPFLNLFCTSSYVFSKVGSILFSIICLKIFIAAHTRVMPLWL